MREERRVHNEETPLAKERRSGEGREGRLTIEVDGLPVPLGGRLVCGCWSVTWVESNSRVGQPVFSSMVMWLK